MVTVHTPSVGDRVRHPDFNGFGPMTGTVLSIGVERHACAVKLDEPRKVRNSRNEEQTLTNIYCAVSALTVIGDQA